MSLKLHGISMSTCSKRVGIILHEKRIPFTLVPVDFASGQHKSPEHLKIQPFGQVPILEDDGFFLFESRAISKYLATKYAALGTPGLVPDFKDLKAAAKFEQASSVESFDFEAVASPILVDGFFAKFKNPAHIPDQAFINKQAETLEGKLDGYERILTKQKYLAGDNITVVDLFHLPHATLLPAVLGKDLLDNEKRPHVAKWWKELQARPSWAAVKDGVNSTERYD
ncbi:thioredoxin-like protein [Pterulicium gracile]|uniref:glutathione transferase n=1 Tax=Pterulicium gracile TaxID=1884261 RepID=A0A5C3Q7X2_9AGAR|nr:thioredoxin-like protein [Pterula gracilis]